MEDEKIVDLYWLRSERAIAETASKYGAYCHTIARNILSSREDSEECVNDTYLRAWNSMPQHRPPMLKPFLGRITRNLALNRHKALTADKRSPGQMPLALDELRECVPDTDAADITDELALAEALNRFLASLPAIHRKIFMRRYWYLCSVREIAAACGMGESRVKMSLLRSRKKLKVQLETDGIFV